MTTKLHDDTAKRRLIKDVGFDRYFDATEWPDYNRQFFDGLAEKYDATNELHSLGTKSRFDHKAVARLPVNHEAHVLDLCTGSGDIAIELAKREPKMRITGVDASDKMLAVATRKARQYLDQITFVPGDALALDFPDDHFDGAVISFGLRNLESLESGLKEMRRVVKPGGFVCNIDQGKPRNPIFNMIYTVQFKHIAPVLGKIIFHRGEFNSFKYLPESNRYFPDQRTLVSIFKDLGLEDVQHFDYWFGAVSQQIGVVRAHTDAQA
jgi:demethylmenaquinone methyltransferase / 2-methoxy-6-polyprenyl-1,4-benzoquinol methylase